MGLAAAELSAPDPRLGLKKRLCEEMEALRGILRKAELVVRKSGDKGRGAPRRGKDGRFVAAKARSESTMEANRTPREKERKTMLPVSEEIIKPPMMEVEAHLTPCVKRSKAMPAPCAKRSKAMPPVEIIEPLISEDEIFSLLTRLSSLSSNMPARIVEFLNKECACHADQKAGEMEIDLGSMRRSALFDLQKLLDDEFAEEEKRRQQKEEPMKVCALEEGEFMEEDCGGATMGPCSGVDGSHVPTVKGLCSQLEEDGEITEEEVDICGDAGPIAIEKFAETERSPSHSSSSSSSGSSSNSSSSGDSSSGSSSSDSSDSDSSDSDCDDECVTSNLTPAVVPKTDASPMAMPMPDKVLSPIAAEELAATATDKNRSIISNSSLLEDGEIEEEESSGASPVASEKFAETVNVNDTGSANDQSTRSTQAPTVCPQPSKPQPAAQDTAPDLSARSFEKKRERQRAYEKPATQSTVRELNARGFEKKHESQRAYEKPAAQSTARDLYARNVEKKHERQRAYEKPAAQSTVRDLYARNVEMKHERQRGYEKVKEMERKRERQRAYRKLQEMERNAKPIFDWIHPRHLMQLGITRPVEYAVTSERRFAAPRGCPVQSLLGLFLKQSNRAGHEEMAND